MPDKILTNHTYAYRGVIPIVASATGTFSYVANGAYRPYSAHTYPVAGFTDMVLNYYNYKVHACSISISVVNPSALEEATFTLFPQGDTFPTGMDASDAATQPYAKSRLLGIAGSNRDTVTLNHYMQTKKIRGEPMNSTNYVGNSTSNPAKAWYWSMIVTYPSSTSQNLTQQVKLKMWIEWFRRETIDPTP